MSFDESKIWSKVDLMNQSSKHWKQLVNLIRVILFSAIQDAHKNSLEYENLPLRDKVEFWDKKFSSQVNMLNKILK